MSPLDMKMAGVAVVGEVRQRQAQRKRRWHAHAHSLPLTQWHTADRPCEGATVDGEDSDGGGPLLYCFDDLKDLKRATGGAGDLVELLDRPSLAH